MKKHQIEQKNSICLKKNSKGQIQWEIKIYGNKIDEILEIISAKALELQIRCNKLEDEGL